MCPPTVFRPRSSGILHMSSFPDAAKRNIPIGEINATVLLDLLGAQLNTSGYTRTGLQATRLEGSQTGTIYMSRPRCEECIRPASGRDFKVYSLHHPLNIRAIASRVIPKINGSCSHSLRLKMLQ